MSCWPAVAYLRPFSGWGQNPWNGFFVKQDCAGEPSVIPVMIDKGFWGADVLLGLSGQGKQRHWLIPERKRLVYTEVERFNEHDRL